MDHFSLQTAGLNGSILNANNNLSFERLFGKLIATHDGNAEFIADKTNRRIKYVIQEVARLIFLPVCAQCLDDNGFGSG
jgi:hypothetical protein